MIVAGPEGFRKNQYRKFNIKRPETAPGDDFAMMREVLGRRFARLEKEDPDRSQGRLAGPAADRRRQGPALARSARCWRMPASTTCRWSASPRARTAMPAARSSICRAGASSTLPPNSPLLFYLQRLRDEAHRFAIGAHRAEARQELHRLAARRGPRHRPGPQARAADAFRHRPRGPQRRARGSREGPRHLRHHGARHLRLFPPGGMRMPALSVIPAKAGIPCLQDRGFQLSLE